MSEKNTIIQNINKIIFDFDGVLTDNNVYVDQNGVESVKCSRSDGLAFDILKKINIESFILSSERNNVVNARAKKLSIPVFHGIKDKKSTLLDLKNKGIIDLKKTAYVGNDLNDYFAMKACGIKLSPSDAHIKIKEISDIVLEAKGGNGIVREIVEDVMRINMLDYLK